MTRVEAFGVAALAQVIIFALLAVESGAVDRGRFASIADISVMWNFLAPVEVRRLHQIYLLLFFLFPRRVGLES